MSSTEPAARPAEPVPAATVVLVRDGDAGIETWMMRRVRSMAFAAGAAVFPGGRVDERDGDISVPWTGPDPDAVAARLGTSGATARELVTAALRELFEETGALLAEPVPPAAEVERVRPAVESRELPFAQFLADHGSALRTDVLHAWSRWVTPPFEKRRYDTWFFVGTLPAGTEARAVSGEADAAGWIGVDDVLGRGEAGEVFLLPPTTATLRDLRAAGTVAALLGQAPTRSLEPIHPEVRPRDDGSFELLADGQVFVLPAAVAR